MKVVVVGSIYCADKSLVEKTLDELHAKMPITLLLHGRCKGTDRIAREWAKRAGVKRKRHVWASQCLLFHKPNLLVAFPGAEGTLKVIAYAEQKKVPVLRIEPC